MMNIEHSLNRLRLVMEEWPVGSVVWHRADARRGIVVEYALDGTGCVMLYVSFGADRNWDKCLVEVLSATRPPDDVPGDDWRGGGDDGREGSRP